MDYYYRDLIKPADRIYVGKVGNVVTFPGKNRFDVSWTYIDPSITHVRVYWNDRLDSTEYSLGPSDNFSAKVRIEGIPEGNHILNLVTFDKNGNRSLAVEALAGSYGQNFQDAIRNRVVSKVETKAGVVSVLWIEDLSATLVETELIYTSTANVEKTILIPKNVNKTDITDLYRTKEIRFRSRHLPQPSAIDSFYTEFEVIK